MFYGAKTAFAELYRRSRHQTKKPQSGIAGILKLVLTATGDKDNILWPDGIFFAVADKNTFSLKDKNFMLVRMTVKRRMSRRCYLEHSHYKIIRTIGL